MNEKTQNNIKPKKNETTGEKMVYESQRSNDQRCLIHRESS